MTSSRERLTAGTSHPPIYIQRASHCYNPLPLGRSAMVSLSTAFRNGSVTPIFTSEEEHRKTSRGQSGTPSKPQIYLCVLGLPRKTTIRNSRGQVRKTLSTGLRHRAFISSNPPKPENLVRISRKQLRPCIGPRGGGFCVPGRTSFAEQRTIQICDARSPTVARWRRPCSGRRGFFLAGSVGDNQYPMGAAHRRKTPARLTHTRRSGCRPNRARPVGAPLDSPRFRGSESRGSASRVMGTRPPENRCSSRGRGGRARCGRYSGRTRHCCRTRRPAGRGRRSQLPPSPRAHRSHHTDT